MNTKHHWYGKKHTAETKRQMSESRKRFYQEGGHSSFFGKPHTDEIKRKIALSRMGEKNWAKRPDVRKKISASKKGLWDEEKNPNWNGGTSVNYYRPRILLRDNFICRDCSLQDKTKGFMDVDHNKPKRAFPELAYKIDNLITLCPNCHRRKTLRDIVLYPQRQNNQYTITK